MPMAAPASGAPVDELTTEPSTCASNADAAIRLAQTIRMRTLYVRVRCLTVWFGDLVGGAGASARRFRLPTAQTRVESWQAKAPAKAPAPPFSWSFAGRRPSPGWPGIRQAHQNSIVIGG